MVTQHGNHVRLFQMLTVHADRGGHGAGRGTRLLQPSTVRGLSMRYRVGMHDEVQGIRCDWSLGLSVGSTLSGAHASASTFGHGGSQSSMGFCDPQHRLSVVIVCNACPGSKPHHDRMHRLATILYEDLGLAPTSHPPSPPLPARRFPSSPVVTRRHPSSSAPTSHSSSPVVTRRHLSSSPLVTRKLHASI